MTPADIDAIADRNLDLWFRDGVSRPGDGKKTLREYVADAIREALAVQDKQWHARIYPPFTRDCSPHGAPDV